ncbi:MAG: 8-oxoguanine deaminase [Spirochaetales bacterium]|nr:MAG: 8-oxoguanine deaminase [Spirochaetales bacterium]
MIHIKNAYAVLTSAEENVRYNCDVLTDGNTIQKVGSDIVPPSSPDVQTIDASGLVVVPGLVNTHHHFYQTFTRNLPGAQNAELFDWLVYLYNIWKHMDADTVWWSTALASAELLKTGCTTSSDHHYLYPQGIGADIMALQFDAAARLGIRFSPTRGSMSRSKKDGGLPPDSTVQDEQTILADCERVIKEFHDPAPHAMRKVALAPCSPFSVSEELMKNTASLARQYGVRLHTHLTETRDEEDYCLEMYKRRPLKLMEDCNYIGEDVWFAHGIFFNDEELDLLASTGTHIAHCPSSNMRLGSGICRVREMLDRGVNVAMAVDGSASNDTSDMLGESRQALLLQRVTKGASALSAAEVWKMSTENGARLLGFENTGRIEPGWAADLALYDVTTIPYVGALSDPAAALLFSGYNHQTAYTIVNGEIAVAQGLLQGIPEDELVRKAGEAVRALYRRAGI